MSLNFRDHAHGIRAKFIHGPRPATESATLDAKRAELRRQMHEAGRYFLGEEILAKQHGGSIFNPRKGWERK